jgi:hypothetical protein
MAVEGAGDEQPQRWRSVSYVMGNLEPFRDQRGSDDRWSPIMMLIIRDTNRPGYEGDHQHNHTHNQTQPRFVYTLLVVPL